MISWGDGLVCGGEEEEDSWGSALPRAAMAAADLLKSHVKHTSRDYG